MVGAFIVGVAIGGLIGFLLACMLALGKRSE